MENWTNLLLKIAGNDSAEGGEGDSGNQTDPKTGSGNQEADANKGNKDEQDLSALPESAQKIIKELRAENAKHRTEKNNLSTKMEKFEKGFKAMFGEEEGDVDPEQKLNSMQGQYEAVATRNAILEIALQNGIPADGVEYFEFLMAKKLESLKEGEELDEEGLAEIIGKIKPANGSVKGNTSTKQDTKGNKGPDQKAGQVTQEQFNKMTITEKSKLYLSNKELYTSLMKNFRG